MHGGPHGAGAADIHAIGMIGGVDNMACVLGARQYVNNRDGRINRIRIGIGLRTAKHQRAQPSPQQTQRAQTQQEGCCQHADLIVSGGNHRRLDPFAREVQIVIRAPFPKDILFGVGCIIGARPAGGQDHIGQQPVGRDEQIILFGPIGREIPLNHDDLTIGQGDQQGLPILRE